MNWDEFAPLIHESWHDKLKPFIESEECDKIYSFLKRESGRGRKIAPLSINTWRCFKETPLTDLKLVIMGMAPYHTFKDGKPIADGLLMGCSVTNSLQPSLYQFYDAMKRELGGPVKKNPDVSYLAHQGVLMYNASLTTEMRKPGSHIKLWAPFTIYLFEHVLDVTGVPIIFLGKDASMYRRYVMPFTWTFTVSHPASAAYNGEDWDSEGIFTNVNTVLKNNNNFVINWKDE